MELSRIPAASRRDGRGAIPGGVTDAKPPRPPRRRLRRTLTGVLVLAALVVTAHGAAWTWATGALAVGMSDWVTQRRAEGWSIDHGPPARGGWPFAARITLDDVRVAMPARANQAALVHEAARLVLQVAPPRLDRLQLLFAGPQSISFGADTIPFAAQRMALDVPLGGGPVPVGLDVAELEAVLPTGPWRLRAGRAVVQPPGATNRAVEGEPAIGVAVQAEGLVLPASSLTEALGREVALVSADALVLRVQPLRGPPVAMAAAWRDGGGAIEVPSLLLRWGPLQGDAQGSVMLDRALQPRMRATLRLVGAPVAVDALAQAGQMDRQAARSLQAVLALMSRTPPEGGPPRVELPVAVADGALSVARVPLLRVAPIGW